MYHVLYTTCHLNHQQRLSGNNFPLVVVKKGRISVLFYYLTILIRVNLLAQGTVYRGLNIILYMLDWFYLILRSKGYAPIK
jgi:hypothetical protein